MQFVAALITRIEMAANIGIGRAPYGQTVLSCLPGCPFDACPEKPDRSQSQTQGTPSADRSLRMARQATRLE